MFNHTPDPLEDVVYLLICFCILLGFVVAMLQLYHHYFGRVLP